MLLLITLIILELLVNTKKECYYHTFTYISRNVKDEKLEYFYKKIIHFFWRENSNIFYKMFICFFAQKFIQFLARNFKYFTRIFGGKIHTSLSAFQILRFFRFLAQKRIRFLAWKFGTIGRLDFTYGQVIYFSEIS